MPADFRLALASGRKEATPMTSTLDRRLARLEAIEVSLLRQRYIWLNEGDAMPEPEPGEQIVIVHWLWDDEPAEPTR
jgi:hypothetical protein